LALEKLMDDIYSFLVFFYAVVMTELLSLYEIIKKQSKGVNLHWPVDYRH